METAAGLNVEPPAVAPPVVGCSAALAVASVAMCLVTCSALCASTCVAFCFVFARAPQPPLATTPIFSQFVARAQAVLLWS